jgi:hypothetical protein
MVGMGRNISSTNLHLCDDSLHVECACCHVRLYQHFLFIRQFSKTRKFMFCTSIYVYPVYDYRVVIHSDPSSWLITFQFRVGNNGRTEKLYNVDLRSLEYLSSTSASRGSVCGRKLLILLGPVSWWFLAWPILGTWTWKWHVPAKHLFSSTGLHRFMSWNIELFISAIVKT